MFHAYAAAVVALVVSGLVAAFQQHALLADRAAPTHRSRRIDWVRVGIVVAILLAAIAANVAVNLRYASNWSGTSR